MCFEGMIRMRTPAEIVREYRKRGYSDEKIRIIALSRPEGLRARILEFIEANPGLTTSEGETIKQYMPLRKDDEGEGGTGAIPEEEPEEAEDDAVAPAEVPDEEPEPVEAPLPRATVASEATAGEKDRILALAREEEPDAPPQEEPEETTSAVNEVRDEAAKEKAVDLEELRAELARGQRRETTLLRKIEKLSETMRERDERLRSFEAREEEFDRAAKSEEELRRDLEGRNAAIADVETRLEAQEARLEETTEAHTEEMHRIINAYENRIKVVRAQGLKANLVAFASAACVLLVFLVSLALREKSPVDAVITPPPDLVFENGLTEQEPSSIQVADRSTISREDFERMMRERDASGRRGIDVATGRQVAASDSTTGPGQVHPGQWTARNDQASDDARVQSESKIRYVVKKGDSLWNICHAYLGSGKKCEDVARDNKLKSQVLHPGQVIVIDLKRKQ